MKKLSQYAESNNITYRTAINHFHKGLIEGAYQLPTGTIVIPDSYKPPIKEHIICYSRVSSSENKSNLKTQSERLVSYCNAKGWSVDEDVSEIGSGLNDKRTKLLKILKEKKATKLVVEHKDRLSRFGVSYIEECLNGFNCELIILNPVENNKEDIIQDFVSVITSFCAKLYGQRRSKRRTEKLIKDLGSEC